MPDSLNQQLPGQGTNLMPGEQPSGRPAEMAPEVAAERGLPPRGFTSARRFQEESGRPAPYSEGKRLGYGLLWSGWTLLLVIAGFSLVPHGSTVISGLLAFALAILAGRYAYRIWTWQAKRLVFFIIW